MLAVRRDTLGDSFQGHQANQFPGILSDSLESESPWSPDGPPTILIVASLLLEYLLMVADRGRQPTLSFSPSLRQRAGRGDAGLVSPSPDVRPDEWPFSGS